MTTTSSLLKRVIQKSSYLKTFTRALLLSSFSLSSMAGIITIPPGAGGGGSNDPIIPQFPNNFDPGEFDRQLDSPIISAGRILAKGNDAIILGQESFSPEQEQAHAFAKKWLAGERNTSPALLFSRLKGAVFFQNAFGDDASLMAAFLMANYFPILTNVPIEVLRLIHAFSQKKDLAEVSQYALESTVRMDYATTIYCDKMNPKIFDSLRDPESSAAKRLFLKRDVHIVFGDETTLNQAALLIGAMPNLTHLSLDCTNILTDDGMDMTAFVLQNLSDDVAKNLKTLSIKDVSFMRFKATPSELSLGDVLKDRFPNLESLELDLSQRAVDDVSLDDLSIALASMLNLKKLVLKIDHKNISFKTFFDFLKATPHLKHFDLSLINTDLDDDGFALLASALEGVNLTTFHFCASLNNFSKVGMMHLARALSKMLSLEDLALKDLFWSNDDAFESAPQLIEAIQSMSQLKSLLFDFDNEDYDISSALLLLSKTLPLFGKLEKLTLGFNGVLGVSAEALQALWSQMHLLKDHLLEVHFSMRSGDIAPLEIKNFLQYYLPQFDRLQSFSLDLSGAPLGYPDALGEIGNDLPDLLSRLLVKYLTLTIDGVDLNEQSHASLIQLERARETWDFIINL